MTGVQTCALPISKISEVRDDSLDGKLVEVQGELVGMESFYPFDEILYTGFLKREDLLLAIVKEMETIDHNPPLEKSMLEISLLRASSQLGKYVEMQGKLVWNSNVKFYTLRVSGIQLGVKIPK